MSILTTPWFWVGLTVVAAAILGAYASARPTPEPLTSGKSAGRPSETKRVHSEYEDGPFLR